jgi:hypothetical protein
MPRLNPTFLIITVHRDEGDAGDTAPSQPASLFTSLLSPHASLLIILLLLNLLLPVAGFVHAIASDNHHTNIVAAETGDADECEDTHHTDHATLLPPSESTVPTDSYHLVPAPLSDSHFHPVDVSLHLPQVVIPIFVPPQIVV